MSELYAHIYAIIRTIPAGRFTTYGTIASIVNCNPRQVGYALAALKNRPTDIPWHRVLNRFGEVSLSSSESAQMQRERLEAEGINFDLKERADPASLWPENE